MNSNSQNYTETRPRTASTFLKSADKSIVKEDFKLKLIDYEKKVQTIVLQLVEERTLLQKRVQELEQKDVQASGSIEDEDMVPGKQLDILRTKLAELAVENASLRDQMDSLLQENAELKNTIQSTPANTKPGLERKSSWAFVYGSIGDRQRDKSSTVPSVKPARLSQQEKTRTVSAPSTTPPTPPPKPRNAPFSPPPSTIIQPLIITSRPNSPTNDSTEGDAKVNPKDRSPRFSTPPDQISSPDQPTRGRDQAFTMRRALTYLPIEAGDDEEFDDDDILLERNIASNCIEVRGGTLIKLVERLSYHKTVDTDYVLTFLLTYRSFCSPEQLLDLLIQRFHITPSECQSTEELEAFAEKRKIIQLRVANVMKIWVEKYFRDFESDPEIYKKAQEFIGDSIALVAEQLASVLGRWFRGERPVTQPIKSSGPLISIPPKTSNFLDFDELDVARQLAKCEYLIFKEIGEEECLNQSWSKPDRELLAPNVVAMIKRFNQVSAWVATEIVKAEKLKERVALLKKFIKIANECVNIGNFNAVMEILAGLQNAAIYRLKKTWEKVESTKLNEIYQGMLDLMSSSENYKTYRARLRATSPPCLPYLGMYLTDLTFIADGNLDTLNGRPDMINFDKRKKISQIITDIQLWQSTPFPDWEEKIIADYIQNIEGLTDKALYKYSLICEPKGGRDNPNRGLNTSTLLRKFKFDL